jgi:serine/threonine protein kinase
MTAPFAKCPSEKVLTDFGQGRLDGIAAETIGAHLETCADCRRVLAGLSGNSIGESVSDARGETPSIDAQRDEHAIEANLGSPPELTSHPDYKLVKELGRGGMGVVYLASNLTMGRFEVLKVINKALLDKAGALERFQQEIRSAARLNHQNIVIAYSAPRCGDLLVLAMEYVKGHDLSQTVQRHGPLPVANAASYGYQAALGLQHAHENKMVHRDINPRNLMLAQVRKKHIIKILDFGLAKMTSEKDVDGELTKSGQMFGTPDFIAPEQILDAQAADIRADIYSLGCTLYFLLTGKPPFVRSSLFEKLQAHRSVEAEALNLVRPEVPPELAALVARMMAKHPDDRYQTPIEVAKALGPFFKPGGDFHKAAAVSPQLSFSATPAQLPLVPPMPATPAPVCAMPVAVAVPQSLIPPIDQPAFTRYTTRGNRQSRRRLPWVPIAVGLLVCSGLAYWGMLTSKLNTSDGVLVIDVNKPNPELLIDGQRTRVTWAGGGMHAEIAVLPGTRYVEVKKDGFKALGKEVVIERGGRGLLLAKLEPVAETTSAASATFSPGLLPPTVSTAVATADAPVSNSSPNVTASANALPPAEEFHNIEIKALPATPAAIVPQTPPPTPSPTRSALRFTGEDCVIVSRLEYNGLVPITLEVWVRPQTREDQTVIGNMNQSGVAIRIIKNHWHFMCHGPKEYKHAVSDKPVMLNQPVHLAGIFDGQQVRLYVDGRLQQIAPALGRHKASRHPFMIGADPDAKNEPDHFFRGIIYEARISSSASYTQDFAPPKGLGAAPQMVMWLGMREGSGDIVRDQSGNHFDGTVLGAKWVTVAEPD